MRREQEQQAAAGRERERGTERERAGGGVRGSRALCGLRISSSSFFSLPLALRSSAVFAAVLVSIDSSSGS